MIPIGNDMYAEPLGREPHEVYIIRSQDGTCLGNVEWRSPRRGYVFSGIPLPCNARTEMTHFLNCCNNAAIHVMSRDEI